MTISFSSLTEQIKKVWFGPKKIKGADLAEQTQKDFGQKRFKAESRYKETFLPCQHSCPSVSPMLCTPCIFWRDLISLLKLKRIEKVSLIKVSLIKVSLTKVPLKFYLFAVSLKKTSYLFNWFDSLDWLMISWSSILYKLKSVVSSTEAQVLQRSSYITLAASMCSFYLKLVPGQWTIWCI